MKSVKKLLLGIITAAIPVVIAACYGPVYRMEGMVKDADTQEGIEGIRVTCINYDDRSTPEYDGQFATTKTNISGYYSFDGSGGRCDIMRFKDIDGMKNGFYDKETVIVEEEEDFYGSIELSKIGD